MTFTKNTYKGLFKPNNPKKYNGNSDNIVYRSSWEFRVMKWFDEHPNVMWWSSEELSIKYFNPIDEKIHRYFPDFIVKIKQKDNSIKVFMIEVKPFSQTQKPVQKRKTKRFITESKTYIVNQSKWKAADQFCQDQGWEFKILTEKELFKY